MTWIKIVLPLVTALYAMGIYVFFIVLPGCAGKKTESAATQSNELTHPVGGASERVQQRMDSLLTFRKYAEANELSNPIDDLPALPPGTADTLRTFVQTLENWMREMPEDLVLSREMLAIGNLQAQVVHLKARAFAIKTKVYPDFTAAEAASFQKMLLGLQEDWSLLPRSLEDKASFSQVYQRLEQRKAWASEDVEKSQATALRNNRGRPRTPMPVIE
jgi:hypothetical protein